MSGWPVALGRPGAVAALALAAAGALSGGLAPGWRDDALRATPVVPVRAVPAGPRQDAAVLPDAGDPASRAADLLALALQHGVAVDSSQQRLERRGPVLRLALSLSARGRYADLRAFVAAALQADPGLALDRLQWRRAQPVSDELEAELHWSLLQPTGAPR